MRIVYLTAGAGNMYCGACARDITLLRALTARGHAVTIYPLYTPIRFDGGTPLPLARIAFGGINVYLQQISNFFQRTPRFLDDLFDAPALLKWVANFAIRTKPADVGPMTVSMLAGTEGRQRKELDKLLDLLAAEPRPDVINITNTLLSGMAPALRARFGVPIVCNVQGEETFVGGLPEPFRTQAHALMRANAAALDLIIAPGETYAREMADYLAVPAARMCLARPGVEVDRYPTGPAPDGPFTVGYLSVITPGKGLDLLVDAVGRLRRAGRDVRLLIAGKPLDLPFWEGVRATLAQPPLQGYVDVLDEVDFAGKLALLRRCHVFTVPSRFPESRGMAMLEAMAAGVPVVIPDAGIYPEVAALTGAGVRFTPGDAESLAAALARVMDDPAAAHAAVGAAGIRTHFSADRIATDVLTAYEGLGVRG